MTRQYVNHIRTLASVTIIYDKGNPVNVHVSDPRFQKIVEHLEALRFDDAAVEADTSQKIAAHTKGKFEVKDGVIVIEGERLPRSLSDRLIQFVESKTPTSALVNFWKNLKDNPSEDSKNDLYTFLDKNHFALTEDGCFVGYKMIRENWTDYYTGKIDNRIGSIVKIERKAVDHDRSQCSSYGLHVAALGYARDVIGTDSRVGKGHLIEVKVNPRDVVAVPTDYNAQKLRCCRYEVLRECGRKEPIKEQTYEQKIDKLKDKSIQRNDKKNDKKAKSENESKPKIAKTMLHPDGRGRLRIPSVMLKSIGVNAVAYVLVADAKNHRILVSATKAENIEINEYKVDADGSIRIHQSYTDGSVRIHKSFGGDKYVAKIIGTDEGDVIEIRASKSDSKKKN